MAQVRTVDFLPEIFQTPVNSQFLAATLDQLVQEPQFKQTQGYVGQRVGPGVNPDDYYVVEPTATRANYQLEPGVISVNPSLTNQVVDSITYPGINDAIAVQGGFTDNANSLYGSDYYSFDPFVNFDPLVNFNQYYWLPEGPTPVDVYSTTVAPSGNIGVTRTTNGYTFSGVDGVNPTLTLVRNSDVTQNIYDFQISQSTPVTINYRVTNDSNSAYLIDYEPNPELTLVRGNTYVFNLVLDGYYPMYIKTASSQGTKDVYNNGVSNNGATSGLITFTVPVDAPDTLYYCSSNQFNMQGVFNVVSATPGSGPQFWIQTNPGIGGYIPNAPNISNRTVFGVTNNGIDIGNLDFEVPPINAQQQFYSMLAIGDVDLVSEIPYEQVNNASLSSFLLSNPNGIDGITSLNGRTVIFLQATDASALKKIWQIQYVSQFGGVTIVLNDVTYIFESDSNITSLNNTKFTILFGTVYSQTKWYTPVGLGFQRMPLLTASMNTLYYQDSEDPEMFGVIQLIDEPSAASINVDDIIGSKNYVSPNGVVFSNGMIVTFRGSVNPVSYTNNSYFVQGVGTAISLLPVDNYVTPELYTETTTIPYDTTPYDVGGFDGSSSIPLVPDYITISRDSPDLNPWSRSNRWFHVDVIRASDAYAGKVTNLDQTFRAHRPILEFRGGLKLYDFGTQAIQPVDVIDFTETDALLNVNGQTSYTVPGQNYPLTAGSRVIFAADLNQNIRDQVFIVEFITPDSVPPLIPEPVIYLVPSSDSPVLVNQNVVCLYGETQQGKSFVYDGIEWLPTQQKTKVNQPPLFDVYDSNGISFGDTSTYPSSTFNGCKLFSYAVNNGVVDAVLGFSLTYLNVNNIGDIVFENSLYDDTFVYVQNTKTITENVSDGFVYEYVDRVNYVKEIGWQNAATSSLDRQQFQFIYDGTPLQLDIVISSETTVPPLQVFVNGQFQFPSAYTVMIDSGITLITMLDKTIANGSIIEVVAISDQVSSAGFYQVPINLENNPFNGNSATFSLGTLRDHYATIAQNINGWVGPINGANNSRDLGNIVPYGLQILQQSSPMPLAGYFMRATGLEKKSVAQFNVFSAIAYNSREYIKFKSQLMNTVATNEFDFWSTSQILDWCINYMTAGRTNVNPFYWGDMLPHGGNYIETQTVVTPITNQTFNTTYTYDYTSSNYFGLSVYLTTNPNTEYELTTLLIRGVDYLVSPDSPNIVIIEPLEVGDIVTIRNYSNTAGSYVPNTPTKLGLYDKYLPEIFEDDTYINPTTMIRGHDGSLTVAFGDIRDEVLLEFEKRIYNNLKTDGNPVPLTADEVIPGFFRTTDYTRQQVYDILGEDFLSWVGWNKLDFKTQDFIPNNAFTYNYSDCGSKITPTGQVTNTAETPLPGAWRGVYEYFYDTVSPNTTPWEMLGFSEKPDWWEVRYGPAPYTSGNLVLWEDLEAGYVSDPVAPYVNPLYVRPGLTNILPVDSEGNLIAPLYSVVGLNDPITFQQSWSVGDGSPVEYSWSVSSSYPFAIMRLLALTKPAQFFSLFADRDLYKFDTNLKQYLYNGRYRLDARTVQVYGNGVSKASYINWMIDYNQQLGWNSTNQLEEDLANLDVRLCYRMATFANQMSLNLALERTGPNSTNNTLSLPPESYQLMLYKDQPFNEVVYSAVVVEKTPKGYAVYGYNTLQPYFNVQVSDPSGLMTTISGGGASVTVPIQYYQNTTQIPYGYVFTNNAAVVDFLLGYGIYLESKGITFTQTENGYTMDWNQMATEFLYFSQQGWVNGTLINLNPSAVVFTASAPNSVIDFIDSTTPENMLLNQNSTAISTNDLIIERLDNSIQITSASNQTISFIRLKYTSYEDIIVFDNVTVFSDLMYDPITAARQNRIMMSAFTTTGWNGQLNAQGFILNSKEVPNWEPNVKYTKGAIVYYKNNYWQASQIVQPSTTFNFANWYKSNFAQIDNGLLPNIATKANQLANSYNVNSANIDADQNLLSYGLIGFSPRQYMTEMQLNTVSQVNIYRSFIGLKGTLQATQIFNNANLGKESGQFSVFENWGILQSTYGANANRSFVELVLNEAYLGANPSTVQIITSQQMSQANQTILLKDIWASSTVITNPNIFPTTMVNFSDTALPTAGYADINDVDITVFSLDDPTNIDSNITKVGIGTYIWAAKSNSYDWDVYRCTKVPGQIVSIANNLNSTSIVNFSTAHGLTVGGFLIIRYFDNTIDGVYRVLAVPSLNSVTISYKFKNTNQNVINGSGLGFTLESSRISQPSDVSTLSYADSLLPGAKVWVDNNGNGQWEVLEKVEPFTNFGTLTRSETENSIEIGYSVSQTINPYSSFSAALVGAPGDNSGVGMVLSYYPDTNGDYQYYDSIELNATQTLGFGSSIDFGGQNWVAVGANNSLQNLGYALIMYLPATTSEYLQTQLLIPPHAGYSYITPLNFGTSVSMKGERWLYVGAPTGNNVYAYGRVDANPQVASYSTIPSQLVYNYDQTILINPAFTNQIVVELNGNLLQYEKQYTLVGGNVVLTASPPNKGNLTISRRMSVDLDDYIYFNVGSEGGSGFNASFTVNNKRGVYYVSQSNTGVDYQTGDVLTIPGESIGGQTPSNDVTIIVTSVKPGTGSITSFTFSGSGVGNTTTFALNKDLYTATNGDSFTVFVNSVIQRQYIDYIFDDTTTEITFLTVPPVGASIQVNAGPYFKYCNTITAPNLNSDAMFGFSVDSTTDSRQIVIGAPNDSVSTFQERGAAYVFDRTTIGYVITDPTVRTYTVDGSVDGPVNVLLNNTLLTNTNLEPNGQCTIGIGNITLSDNVVLTVGDILQIETNQFIFVQKLSLTNEVDEAKFGYDVTVSDASDELYIGAPWDGSVLVQAGSVERFINQSKEFGVISTTNANPQINIGETIRINTIEVAVPDYPLNNVRGLVDVINASNIPNAAATYIPDYTAVGDGKTQVFNIGSIYSDAESYNTLVYVNGQIQVEQYNYTYDNSNQTITFNIAPPRESIILVVSGRMTLSVINAEAALQTASAYTGISEITVLPGVIGTLFDALGFQTYVGVQTFTSPLPTAYAHFGSSVNLNTTTINLVVGAPNGNAFEPVTFDNNTTIFDEHSTTFSDTAINSGVVYTFNYLPSLNSSILNPGQFVFGQQIYDTSLETNDKFGTAINYTSGKLLIGAPGTAYDTYDNVGDVYVYYNRDNLAPWAVIHQQVPVADTTLMNSVFTYDSLSQSTQTFFDFINPLQGKILGVAAQNIDYIGAVDPANYNNGPIHNIGTSWGQEHVGQIWWDTDTVRFINPNQNDISFTSSQWAGIFPGSSVDIYQWISSKVPPTSYAGPGTPMSTVSYTVKAVLDEQSILSTIYYFWVKGLTTVDVDAGKTLSTNAIASYISSPISSGIPYVAMIDSSTVALYNAYNLIVAKQTILHIEYDQTPNNDCIHTEYQIISDGDPESFLNDMLYLKLQDSFCGVNLTGALVPDTNLGVGERYGVQFRPRQSMFINRFTALENYLQYVNSILIQYTISNSKSFSLLNTSDPIPPATYGTTINWQYEVDTYEELLYQDISSYPIGTLFLVKSDSTQQGFWTIYQIESTASIRFWQLVKVQTYDTPQYWYYTNWYASGYNQSSTIVSTVPNYASLSTLTVTEVPVGSSVKVIENNSGQYEIYVRTNTGWDLVCIENGTIQFSETLWNYGAGSFGFDDATFDAQYFDQDPVIETRYIIQAINEQLLVGDLSVYRNRALVLMFEYIYTEQASPYWLMQTSLVNVEHYIRGLDQYPIYKPDNQNFVLDYFNEVKPYHVVVRSFKLVYDGSDAYLGNFTDFDCPSYWNTNIEVPSFTSPVLLPYDHATTPWQPTESDTASDAVIWQDTPWIDWFNNYALSMDDVNVNDGGSGYATVPTVTVVGNCTVQAQLTATINDLGQVTGAIVTNPGLGYIVTPQITISGGGGTGASLYPVMSNQQVRSIKTVMKYDRYQYYSTIVEWQPNIVYVDGTKIRYLNMVWSANSIAATAVATITYGTVTSVTVTNNGSGNYSEPPTVTVTGKCISSAVLTANIDSNGYVTAVNVVNPGSGYIDPPTITMNPPGLVVSSTFEPIEWELVPASELSGVDRTMGFYTPTQDEPGLVLDLLINGVSYPGVQVAGMPYQNYLGYGRLYSTFPYSSAIPLGTGTMSLDAIYESSYTNVYLGVLPTSINVDGGQYISAYASHAPEELVPGIEYDTLDFRVYTRGGGNWTDDIGHAFPQGEFKFDYSPTGDVLSFANIVPYPVSLVVTNESRGIDLTEGLNYSVDWVNQTVTVTSGAAVPDLIVVTGYGLGGGNQLYQNSYNGGDVGNQIIVPVAYPQILEFAIFVNGQVVTNYTYAPYDVNSPATVINFMTTWTSSDEIVVLVLGPTGTPLNSEPYDSTPFDIGVYNDEPGSYDYSEGGYIDYGWSTAQTQTFVATSGTAYYPLTNFVGYTNPLNFVATVNGLRVRSPASSGYIADGKTNTFALPIRLGFSQSVIVKTSLLVYINSELIPSSEYTLNSFVSEATTITFVSTPNQGDNILIGVLNGADCYISGSDLHFVGATLPLAGSSIQVTTWNDNRQQDMLTQVYVGPVSEGVQITEPYDTTPFDEADYNFEQGSYDYSLGDVVYANNLIVGQPVTSPNRLWVTLNGKHLFNGTDFTVVNNEVVLSTGILNPTDVVIIMSDSGSVVPGSIAFRIFQDMNGQQALYRISEPTTTVLVQSVSTTDDIIYVQDVSHLPLPRLDLNIWGVITINGERIMYRNLDPASNTVSSLLRGTAGTGVDEHEVGSLVYDMSVDNLLPPQYQPYIVSTTVMADGTQTIFQAPNIQLGYSTGLDKYGLVYALYGYSASTFTPSNPNALMVYVGGVLQYGTYTVVEQNPAIIEFDVAPPAGVEVTMSVKRQKVMYQQGVDSNGVQTPSNGIPLQLTNTTAAQFLRE